MTRLSIFLLFALILPIHASAGNRESPEVDPARYYPVDKVQVGQKGYGMTVFQGREIERFEVEILGVLNGAPSPGQNLIIARLSGGNVERTKVFAGMSGSPVYLDGRIVGAVAYAFPFATEPIAGITPIGQMIGQLKDAPARSAASPKGQTSFTDLVAMRGVSADMTSNYLKTLPTPGSVAIGVAAAGNPHLHPLVGQAMQPIATPLAFGGIPQSVIDQFAPEFKRLGILPVAGLAGNSPIEPLAPYTENTLQPGSSVVVSLVRGDFNMAASGTVTERAGERIYAFGHPFLSLGATSMPMAESEVVTVVPNLNNSFKFASATKTVGSIAQDRSSGIGGRLGDASNMIPVRVVFKNSHGDRNTFTYEVIDDAQLSPLLVNMTLFATVMGTERQIGDQTVEVRGKIRLEGQPEIVLENRFTGASNAALMASMSVAQPLQLLMGSGFRGIGVEGIEVEISASEERNIGELERIWVDRTRVERGQTIEVQAFARTEEGDEYVERIPIQIPRDAPIGKLAIQVGDGASLIAADETLANFSPENLRQLVDAINKLKKNDRLYVKVLREAGGAIIENHALTALPPSVLSSLGSPRASAEITPLATATLQEKELPPARFIITGTKMLTINVVR